MQLSHSIIPSAENPGIAGYDGPKTSSRVLCLCARLAAFLSHLRRSLKLANWLHSERRLRQVTRPLCQKCMGSWRSLLRLLKERASPRSCRSWRLWLNWDFRPPRHDQKWNDGSKSRGLIRLHRGWPREASPHRWLFVTLSILAKVLIKLPFNNRYLVIFFLPCVLGGSWRLAVSGTIWAAKRGHYCTYSWCDMQYIRPSLAYDRQTYKAKAKERTNST